MAWYNPLTWFNSWGTGNKSTNNNSPSQATKPAPKPGEPGFIGPLQAAPKLVTPDLNNNQVSSSTTYVQAPRYTPSFNKKFSFDENQARTQATGEFNPFYENKQNQLRETAQIGIGRANEDYTRQSKVEQDALNLFLENSGLLQGRNQEDLVTELGSLEAQLGEQRAESAYERTKQIRGLVGQLSQSGLQFGGMAAEAGQEAAQGRNLVKNRVERVYNEGVSGAQTRTTRTGEDLTIQEKGRRQDNAAKVEEITVNKNRAIEDINRNLQFDLTDVDEERKYKIEQAVNQKWDQAFNEWDLELKQFMAKYGVQI